MAPKDDVNALTIPPQVLMRQCRVVAIRAFEPAAALQDDVREIFDRNGHDQLTVKYTTPPTGTAPDKLMMKGLPEVPIK